MSPSENLSGLDQTLTDSVAVGIMVGLVVGETLGITAATWLVSRFTRAVLDSDLAWPDVRTCSFGGPARTTQVALT